MLLGRVNAELSAIDAACLVEQASDAMIFADREGVIRIWNPAAERIFGYPAAASIGQNLDIIIPEHLREAHWTGYHRALASGDTRKPTRLATSSGSVNLRSSSGPQTCR